MHGEYKPPGGKLVAADVEVASGRLARVQVSGDRFLEPTTPSIGQRRPDRIPAIADAP